MESHSTEVNKQRTLNLEVLRILAMFLVLLIHYVQATGMATINSSLHLQLGGVINYCISIVCVNCFVLISGFFGISWKKNSIYNLLFQILFWCITATVFAIVIFEVDFKVASTSIVSILRNWFIGSYLGLYALAPVLNAFIEKASEKKLGLVLIAYYSWSTLFGYLGKSPSVNEGMSCLSLVGLYLLGAYLKKVTWKSKFSSTHYIAAYITCVILLSLITIVLRKIGFASSPLGYLNPIVIVESCALFLFFNSITISKGRNIITFVSSSVFAVFLFHYHSLIFPHFRNVCISCEEKSTLVGYIFLLIVLLSTVMFDKVRLWLFNKLYKW